MLGFRGVTVCTTYKMFFKGFGRRSGKKTCFYTFFDPINGRCYLYWNFLPINTSKPPPFLTPTSPTLSPFSFYNHVFSSLVFHRKRPLWKFSGIVWTVNEDGTELQRSAVCLGVMLVSLGFKLVCLGARSTIMVSCSLESPLPSPTLFSSSPPSSFLPPYFPYTSGWSHWYSLPPPSS